MRELNDGKYYHVVLQRSIFQTGTKPNFSCEINQTKDHIMDDFVLPFNSNKKLLCGGDIYETSDLIRINFYFTPNIIDKKTDRMEISSFLQNEAEDVTGDFFREAKRKARETSGEPTSSIPDSTNESKPDAGPIINVFTGDVYQGIENSTIVSKSSVENAFNKLGQDPELSRTIVDIAQFIDKSGNPAAGALFNKFTEELNKPAPDKSRLRSFGEAIENVLPTMNSLSLAFSKILYLFS